MCLLKVCLKHDRKFCLSLVFGFEQEILRVEKEIGLKLLSRRLSLIQIHEEKSRKLLALGFVSCV